MKAVQITTLDGPEALEIVDLPEPVAGDDQVLIRVRAAGVAFPEVLQSRGQYQIKPPLPFVPGAEVAGEVVTAPAGSGFAPGDRVTALPLLGGFAEYAVANTDLVFPIPDNISFEQGAALPFNYLTCHFGLLRRGHLAAGESVLVHGAAGGIGTSAIQIAKAFGAGSVIAVTSTDAKGEIAVAAGADEYVLASSDKGSFKDAVKERGGVDLVVDPVGGDRFTDSLRSLKEHGRLLVIGFTGGEIPTVRVNRLLLNNISVVGVGWGAFAIGKPGYMREQWNEIAPHVASGALTPPLGRTFSFDQVSDALLELDERRATGKVLLIP
ncbi:MAG TPA: NADPH:quinone oxidoreductase family protein [Aeromicrobium sp.]|nr:NADPH:quinone oxidoreductase family protein [Aeromicrobium sp.]